METSRAGVTQRDKGPISECLLAAAIRSGPLGERHRRVANHTALLDGVRKLHQSSTSSLSRRSPRPDSSSSPAAAARETHRGLLCGRTSRSGPREGEWIEGTWRPIFIRNVDTYFLTDLFVYADGTIWCWERGDLDGVAREAAETGWAGSST